MDVRALLDSIVTGLGYELVDSEIANGGRLLRVFIDKPTGVDIEDCVQISNHLSRVFIVEGVDYDRLEVSSPGLDRSLRKRQDFVRFAGERVRVKLRKAMGGRKNFVGLLRGVEGENLNIEVDGQLLSLQFEDLDKARLVPNV